MSLQVKIGFVGAGAMAQAIAEGLLTSGTLSPDNILASATSSRFRAWWEERKIKFSEDNHSVIEVSIIVMTLLVCHSIHVTSLNKSNRHDLYAKVHYDYDF